MKKFSILFTAFLVVLLIAVSSFAKFPQLWNNTKLAKEIGLSDKQVNKLKERSISTQKQMIKIRAEIELQEIDLREVLEADNPDEDKAIGLIKEIMKFKTEQRILKTKQKIALKKTLSEDQMEKLHDIMKEHHKKSRDARGKFRQMHPEHPDQHMKKSH